MLDPTFVAEHPEVVADHLARRGADAALLEAPRRIAELQRRRGALLHEVESLRAERKRRSRAIGALLREGRKDEAEAGKAEVRAMGERIRELEQEVEQVEAERTALLMSLPNLLDERVPEGRDASDNVVLATHGEPPALPFPARDHVAIAEGLGCWHPEAAARIAGARFAVLSGHVARLERALIQWFLDLHVTEHGYTEVMVPYIVWRTALEGTGQLPKFEEDLFRLAEPVNGQDAFLVPTAEVPVTNLDRERILEEEELPRAWACFTPCFRAEAGSHGRDTRGLIRQHQFHKVELVRITTPERGHEEHEMLTRHAEACLERLGLPYRRVALCSGDIGFGARLCYDLEVWLPGQGAWREISSCSLYGDFQARRMGLRYRPRDGGRPRYCATINGSGLAVGRTVVAILENFQEADGAVRVPEVLRPYMGGLERLEPAAS